MKSSRKVYPLLLLLLTAFPCFAHHLAVVVNKQNSTAEVAPPHLAKIFLLEAKKWPDGKDIVVVLHKDSAGEMATLSRLNRMSSDELKAFVASHKEIFALVDSDAEVLRVVESTPGAVGLVDVRSITDQVNVLKVGGKLPMEQGYLPH